MTINIDEEVEVKFDFEYKKVIEEVIEKVLDYEKCPYECEVNVLFVDGEMIREINKEQREIDKTTDVLSFPMLDYEKPSDFSNLEEDDSLFDLESGELIFGDIVLNIEKIYSQAEEYGHSVLRELAFLVTHSMLHLCGYDHMEDEERKIMEDRQKEILDELKISR